ncbi:hypothetical protein AG1IA_06137 [Rhizoctonia solani AG-1 IA]|uniref:Uncharacterized protein n=1 Tax=Thanatephorus cucumeris (strain AG1-IA) TaxID=983506 RepID=L8WNY7_THACA|nr:hypothetical protein AG1IA_06137 [Rhizoctonia solani AG-1 IA]
MDGRSVWQNKVQRRMNICNSEIKVQRVSDLQDGGRLVEFLAACLIAESLSEETPAPGSEVGPNENRIPFRVLEPTPIRPAIAVKRSSISWGIAGAVELGRNSAPRVVFPSEGLLDGGKTTEGRDELGTVTNDGSETSGPERGGGRGRGAHPVRRGSGLMLGRGEIDEVGDDWRCGDLVDVEVDEGEISEGTETVPFAGTRGAWIIDDLRVLVCNWGVAST